MRQVGVFLHFLQFGQLIDLMWLLQGERVVALIKDTALIQTANGTVAYRRYNKPARGSNEHLSGLTEADGEQG